jgi:prolyl-tRNA synthetase
MPRVQPLYMSTLFGRTLREDPADADTPGHRLLVRAGYIRRAAPGIFSMLPLGWIVMRNIEGIVRQEMDGAGFQEVHFPALLPREPYEATGRWTEYGDSLFRLKDRRGADYLLGPTHEEMFTLLVKDICTTYKDLPVSLYQIQTKYRDEVRPRAGLLRGREFVMKDSYSFDLDTEGLQASYAAHRAAYIRVFDRLGLPYVIVAAVSGAMGGSASEEFLAPMEVGEDTFVQCSGCGYAANTEAATAPAPERHAGGDSNPAHVEDTPATATIQSLVDHLNGRDDLQRADRPWAAADTLKNILVLLAHPGGATEALAVGLPGDRELDMKRLQARVEPAQASVFGESEFEAFPQLVKGYIGPGALGEVHGIRYLVDPRIADGTAWVTGANIEGRHVIGLVAGRDFEPDGTIDVAEVRTGDPCPQCGAEVTVRRGIELGHIFQLGRKYADALGLEVAGPEGHPVTVTMGSYGIGVSRALAAIAESTLNEKGLCWPRAVAPADVHIVAAGRDDAVLDFARTLTDELSDAGVRTMYDDRVDVSAGVKFKDAELIGVPTVVVVGKALRDGSVEVRDRRLDTVDLIPATEALRRLVALCGAAG